MKMLSVDTAWNLGRSVAVNAIRTNPLVLMWIILAAFALAARICLICVK